MQTVSVNVLLNHDPRVNFDAFLVATFRGLSEVFVGTFGSSWFFGLLCWYHDNRIPSVPPGFGGPKHRFSRG